MGDDQVKKETEALKDQEVESDFLPSYRRHMLEKLQGRSRLAITAEDAWRWQHRSGLSHYPDWAYTAEMLSQLGSGIKPETLTQLRQLAARDNITMAEVIERALALYARC